MTVIRFSPDKYTCIDFTLFVARNILSDECVLADSNGLISFAKQQELGFTLTAELHNVIEYAKEQAIRHKQSIEFTAETAYGAIFVEASLYEGRLSVFVDAFDNRIETFKNIMNELIDFQAAYAS